MKEIREAAEAYHANLPQNEKTEATKILKSMDSDGDGKINLKEFIDFVNKKKSGPTLRYDFESLFKELDKDEDGTLEFEDVLTLFYLYKTGRFLICGGCEAFIKGIYFTCVDCFYDADNSFDLCCSCYRNSFFLHNDDHTTFVDNYAFVIRCIRMMEKNNKIIHH
ncbi:Calcium-binding EF-hand [Corchorus capsularis]|uniref:Calcium-binding EF-hand n=1 Tax=Corchorus capsularis TaxID=210143 RepID=A0A1R3HFA6_COCAP|nr:Calcium-binding EF-hand [Corchorus capsularis]